MRILFLSSSTVDTSLPGFLTGRGHAIERQHDPMDDLSNHDLVVSFGYRHLLRESALRSARRTPVNLHISYLPYNRGAHPLFWASFEGTPVGVTIHEIDAGVDTGPIICQQLVPIAEDDTFASGYVKIMSAIEAMFVANWPSIEAGTYQAAPQSGPSTKHRVRDLPEGFSWSERIVPTIARLRGREAPQHDQGTEHSRAPAQAS